MRARVQDKKVSVTYLSKGCIWYSWPVWPVLLVWPVFHWAEFCTRSGLFICLVISRVELIRKDKEKIQLSAQNST